jgi:electron transfer flavoprotein alpha subunit
MSLPCGLAVQHVQLSILVLAEHKDGALLPNTLHTLTAAKQLGGPVTVLVAGGVGSTTAVAAAASKADGVTAVLTAEHSCLAHSLAEPAAGLLGAVQRRWVDCRPGGAIRVWLQLLGADQPPHWASLAAPIPPLLPSSLVVRSSCSRKYTHVLAPSSTLGRNVLPRAAALLDVQVRTCAQSIACGMMLPASLFTNTTLCPPPTCAGSG